MLSVRETIVVEGVYDKIKLGSLVSSNIVVTNGFQIFKNEEMKSLLRRLARETGVVILTDSDSAGFQIRNYLKNLLASGEVKQAYIPSVPGREKRKAGKKNGQGLLGVEAMDEETLRRALVSCGCRLSDGPETTEPKSKLQKKDFYALGLSGGVGSREKREALLRKLELPLQMPVNLMLDVCNVLYGKEKFLALYERIAHEP